MFGSVSPEDNADAFTFQNVQRQGDASYVRAFCAAMHHSDAKFGVFITLHPVTKGMRDLQDLEGTIEHNGKRYPRLQFWQIDDAYFENPESLNQLVKLPWRIESRPKSERHFKGEQLEVDI